MFLFMLLIVITVVSWDFFMKSVMTPHKQHVSRDHQTQGLLSSWANWRTSVCSHEVV